VPDTPAILIPDLERLMRDVLRSVFEDDLGEDWLANLTRSSKDALERSAGLAASQRPKESLRDNWDSAGVGEISGVVQSRWTYIAESLDEIWPSPAHAKIDLERLRKYRGGVLHDVGAPPGPWINEEMAGLITRLRVGFEALRRTKAGQDDEWWPYIETVHSNVPEFNGLTNPDITILNEGDLVSFDVRAVHPTDDQNRLRYRLTVTGASNTENDRPWQEKSTFELTARPGRQLGFLLSVKDVSGDDEDAGSVVFMARVRPIVRP
jgi:hypothetical protein